MRGDYFILLVIIIFEACKVSGRKAVASNFVKMLKSVFVSSCFDFDEVR